MSLREIRPPDIAQRVASRYAHAASLPDRPDLDRLLRSVAPQFHWEPEAADGRGAYVNHSHSSIYSVATLGSSVSRHQTRSTVGAYAPELDDDVLEARDFEQRLLKSAQEGGFLALTVAPAGYHTALESLTRRFDVEVLDLEAAFVRALHEAASRVGAAWDTVVAADAADRTSQDWRNLNRLIASLVVPDIRQRIAESATSRTAVLTNANWLARYGQLGFIEQARDLVQTDQLHGLWLLIPSDRPQPMLQDQPVPVITPGQRARIPETWCRNLHRGKI